MEHGQITLHLKPDGPYVDLESFVIVMDKFRLFLAGLKNIAPGEKLDWLVTDLGIGSAKATLKPIGGARAVSIAPQIAVEGLKALEEGKVPTDSFPEDSIKGARILVELMAKKRLRMTVSNEHHHLELTNRTAMTAREILDIVVWEDLGSVEGSLDAVNLHDNFRCNIYDLFSGNRIECHFRAELIEKIRVGLKRRVQAFGLVRYNRHGRVLSILAEDIKVFPEENQLPSIDEIAGLTPGITGGLSAEEYIRRLRDDH